MFNQSLCFLLIIRAQGRTSAFRAQKIRYWRFGQNGISVIFYYYFARKRGTFTIIGIHDQTRPQRRPARSSSIHFHLSVNFSITILLLLVSYFSHLHISCFHPIFPFCLRCPSTLWHPDPYRTIKASRPRLNTPMLKVTKCPGIFTPNF